jgi:hypothetical protein
MAVMVASLPIPGYIASRLQVFQREAMKRTDARVQSVTETLSILRMIKIFGWESKISGVLDEKRNEELVYIKAREMAGLANNVVKYACYLCVSRSVRES